MKNKDKLFSELTDEEINKKIIKELNGNNGPFHEFLHDAEAIQTAQNYLIKISIPIHSSPQPDRLFQYKLAEIVSGKNLWEKGKFIGGIWDVYAIAFATNRQRAEAFLWAMEYFNKE